MTVAPRRSLLVVLGLALAAAVFPAAAAQAEDQPPADQAQLAVPTVHPGPVGPAQPPTGGNGDLANPTVDPDPDPHPDPDPEPDPDPDPSDGGGHPSIPTPQRVDTGLGGTAGPSGQPGPTAAVVSLALALLVVLVVLALPASARRAASRSAR
jgi:hypothetical protein